jgi:DNA-binding IclR family transcriptional regulator
MPAQTESILGCTRSQNGIQVISRAAAVLRQLALEREGMTVIDVAHAVDLPRSTTHRIILALTREGLARRDSDGRFTLGLEFESLAEAARFSLRRRLAPHVLRISEQTGETAELSVLSGGDVLFIDGHASRQTLRVVSEIGARAPVHATASGKALLATLPDARVESMLPRALAGLTRSTITSRSRLLKELDGVRRTGTACDVEEHSLGVCSVAGAVTDEHGDMAALAVVVPTARFERRAELEALLLREIREIQRKVG